MKKSALRLIEKIGYSIVPRWRFARLAMATRLREIFGDYNIETVIDVGANNGQYRNFLRNEVGFQGKIASFEPLPDLAESLRRRARRDDPEWSIYACALGRQPGGLDINVMANALFSSFRQPVRNVNPKVDEM